MQSPINNSPLSSFPRRRESSAPQSPIDRNRHNPTESYTILQKFVCARTRARGKPSYPPSHVILVGSRHTRPLLRHSREGGNLGGVDAGTPTRRRESPRAQAGTQPSPINNQQSAIDNPPPPTSYPHPPTSFPRRRESRRGGRGNPGGRTREPNAHNLRQNTPTHHGDTP